MRFAWMTLKIYGACLLLVIMVMELGETRPLRPAQLSYLSYQNGDAIGVEYALDPMNNLAMQTNTYDLNVESPKTVDFFAPDGTHFQLGLLSDLIDVNNNYALFRIHGDDHNERIDLHLEQYSVRFSADGRSLYYRLLSDDFGFYRYDLDRGERERIANNVRRLTCSEYDPAWCLVEIGQLDYPSLMIFNLNRQTLTPIFEDSINSAGFIMQWATQTALVAIADFSDYSDATGNLYIFEPGQREFTTYGAAGQSGHTHELVA